MMYDATEYRETTARRGPGTMRRMTQAAARLVVPVLGLLVVLIWADFGSDQTVTWLDSLLAASQPQFRPSAWLTAGHLILPLMFFVISLTNRRYGAGMATAQVVAAWGVLGGLVYDAFSGSGVGGAALNLPPVRTCVSFVVALVFAQFVAINVFEWTRGHPWWRAPLYAGLWGAAAYCFVFYPSARYGLGVPWVNQMITHFGLMAGTAFVLLVPYHLLRPVIKPLPGLGGA